MRQTALCSLVLVMAMAAPAVPPPALAQSKVDVTGSWAFEVQDRGGHRHPTGDLQAGRREAARVTTRRPSLERRT